MAQKIRLLNDEEPTKAEVLQRKRSAKFAPQAGDRIRAAENCLFSLLPVKELSRLAGEWYDACSQAMLHGNYGPIEKWVRSQSEKATEQGFAPKDLRQLLLICRDSAIELDGWNRDIFSAVDEATEEVLNHLHPKPPPVVEEAKVEQPEVSENANLTASSSEPEERGAERRRFVRNRLKLPIRILCPGAAGHEMTYTKSVSRGGIYYESYRQYEKDQVLKINFPYWNNPGAINIEYPAKVVRIDPLGEHFWGVALDFQ